MVHDRREYLLKAFQPADEPDVESLQPLPKTRTATTNTQLGQRGHAGKDGRSAVEGVVKPLHASRDKRKAGANTSTSSGSSKAKRPVASTSSEPSSSASSSSLASAKTKYTNGNVHRDTAPAVSSKQGNKHNKPTSASGLKVREINSDSSQDEIQLSSSGVKVQARSSGNKRKRSRKRAKESGGRAPPNGSAESTPVRDGTRSESHSPLPTPPSRQGAASGMTQSAREGQTAAIASTPGAYMFSSDSSAGDSSASVERAVVPQKQQAPLREPPSQSQSQSQPPKPSTPSRTIVSVEIPNTARASVKRKPSSSNDNGRYGGTGTPPANGAAGTPKKRRIEATSERAGSSVALSSRTVSSLASSSATADGAEGKPAGTKASKREPKPFVYQEDLTSSEADRTLMAPPKPTAKAAPASTSAHASTKASSSGPQQAAPQLQLEVVINKPAIRPVASTPSKASAPAEESVAAAVRKPVPALLPASLTTKRAVPPSSSVPRADQVLKAPSPSRSAGSASPRAAKTAIALGSQEYANRKTIVATNGRPAKAIPPSASAIAAEAIAYSAIQKKQSRTPLESHAQSQSQGHSQRRTLVHKCPSPKKSGKRPVKGDLPAPPPRHSGQIVEADESDEASDANEVEVVSDRDNPAQRKKAQTAAGSSQSRPGPSSSQSRSGHISATKPSKAVASSRSSAKSKELASAPIGSSQGSIAGRVTSGQATPKADARGPARPEHLSQSTDSDTPIVASGSAKRNGSNLQGRSRDPSAQTSSRKRPRDSDEFHEDDEVSSTSSKTKPRARPSTNKVGLAALRAKEAAASTSTPRRSPRGRPTPARRPASAKGKAVRTASTAGTGTEEDGGADGDEDDSDNVKEIYGQATQKMWFENVLNGRDPETGELHSDASQSTLASQSQEAAQESEEEDAFGEKVAKGPLCPFCDGPIPARPTPRLLEMLRKLCLRSDLELRGGSHNPHALNLPSMVTAATCKRHRDEREVIPMGLQRGYPPPESDAIAEIDKRFERVCYEALAEVVTGKRESPFLNAARLEWETKGARKMGNVLNEWSSFDQELPGYYGPQGFEAIINSINTYMIQRDSLILAHLTVPLEMTTYLRRVMVPEAAVALIMDDYSGAPDGPIDRERATEVLRESRAYGAAVFALDGTFGRDGLDKAAETAAEKKQRHREEDETEKERQSVLASGDRRRVKAVERGPKAFAHIKKAVKAVERSAKRS